MTTDLFSMGTDQAQAARQVRNRTQEERVIYYRKPEGGKYSGWITWADSQPTKQIDYISRGWQPLPQFGNAGSSDDIWGPILRHPRGPEQFPVSQILTFRWYKNPPVKGVKFPQLAGIEIVEYECPECDNREFHDANFLARHLRVHHDYDRLEINQLGKDLGIDFTRTLTRGGKRAYAYEVSDTSEGYVPEEEEETDPNITIERRRPGRPAKSYA